MEDYTLLGYDKTLNKPSASYTTLTSADFAQRFDSIDANKITQGISQGTNLGLDYDKGLVTIQDNGITRIVTGKFLDGKYGLRVYDASGTVVIDNTA